MQTNKQRAIELLTDLKNEVATSDDRDSINTNFLELIKFINKNL